MAGRKIVTHRDLNVYRTSFTVAMRIYELSKQFPAPERFALTDQIRRSSRSVCANLAEAWRKRRYEGAFVSKLSDAEMEAAETQTWIEFAASCGYLPQSEAILLDKQYEQVLRAIVGMIAHRNSWLLK